MKHLLLLLSLGSMLGLMFIFSSCEEAEEVRPNTVLIHYSVVDKQVAFAALTTTATSWSWDFGDGTTSTEKNPVHVYENGGYYTATLTAEGPGGTGTDEVDLAVALTPYVLLTGGPTAENGKTWKLSAAHSEFDKLANADADFTVVDGTPAPLPQGVFDLFLGMGEVYQDEYTFHFDGSYSMDLKDDNASFSGAVFQFVTTGGATIVNDGGLDFGLCTALHTPASGATFTYVENEDFTCSSVYGAGGQITYEGVSTLDFSGDEFVGFNDFQSKVILQSITDSKMRLVMFMAAGQDPPIIGINTNALILTFEVVD